MQLSAFLKKKKQALGMRDLPYQIVQDLFT